MKRLLDEEIENYIILDPKDPKFIEYAVAFSTTTDEKGWDNITYYGIKKHRRQSQKVR